MQPPSCTALVLANSSPVASPDADTLLADCLDPDALRAVLECKSTDTLGSSMLHRCLYTPEILAQRARYVQPGHEHRDATRSATDIAYDPSLALPPGLSSANDDEQIVAWRSFRSKLALALSIRLSIGCDWRVMRVSLSNTYERTFPRLHSFLQVALRDHALATHPVLHAEVLLFKADLSFGSTTHSHLGAADLRWNSITSRPATTDVVTLAEDITLAYVEKLSNPDVTIDSVWRDKYHRRFLRERYYHCLRNDLVSAERGAKLATEFLHKWTMLEHHELQKVQLDMPLDIRAVARRHIRPLEASRASSLKAWNSALGSDESMVVAAAAPAALDYDADLYYDSDASAKHVSEPDRRPPGLGARARRDARRGYGPT